MEVRSRSVDVRGVRTAVLEAGDGPPLVLLHGGSWGESAAESWGPLVGPLAATGRRVVAPDLLGFGGTAKLRDFEDLPGSVVRHVAALLEVLGITSADVAGLSMGGTFLLADAVSPEPVLPVTRMVLVSAGGAPIEPDVRRALMDFDGTPASTRRQVAMTYADPSWAADDDFVARRHAASVAPGHHEWFASLALRPPGATPPPPGDRTPYERVRVPTLVVAGGADALKPPGWYEEPVRRIPGARLHVVRGAGHCPQVEAPEDVLAAMTAFLDAPALQEVRS